MKLIMTKNKLIESLYGSIPKYARMDFLFRTKYNPGRNLARHKQHETMFIVLTDIKYLKYFYNCNIGK